MRRVLRERLATPSGQMSLIGAMIAGGAALAVLVATQRPFFEKYVREKYAPPQQRITGALRSIDDERDSDALTSLSLPDRRLAYEAWMQGADEYHASVPAAMARADAPLYLARAWQTLVCGSGEQRMLAIRFLVATRHDDAVEVLRRARERASARHEDDLSSRLDQAIQALRKGGPR